MGRLKALPPRLSRPAPRLAPPAKVADAFYLSPEWRALKARRRLDPDYYEVKRRLNPGEWLVLDHIKEIRDGGDRLDPANTQWLTSAEHNAKTARRKAERARSR